MTHMRVVLLVLFLAVTVVSCGDPSAATDEAATPITDSDYLTADLWDDGQAEVAFYQVERTQDQYGRANDQTFTVGTYLVKHRFSPTEMTKTTDGSGTSSFKYALFYEVESGSYEYKRNWVVNVRQNDLRPFKHSFTSFDWCSNQYRELAYPPDGPIQVRMRSDDYGNRRSSFEGHVHSYPPAALPVVVRGLDFDRADTLSFAVTVADSNAHVSAKAVEGATETLDTPAGPLEVTAIHVSYEAPVPSLIGEESDRRETYWRSTGPERHLVRLAAESGRYRMTLVEQRRSAYWRENVWAQLDQIDERP